MDSDEKLTHRYVPSVGRGSLVTGDAKLEFVRVDDSELVKIHGDPNLDPMQFAATPYGDGDYYQYGQKADDPLNAIFDMEDDLRDTMNSIQDAASSIEQAGVGVNRAGERVSQVIDGTDSTIEDVADEAVKALEEFQGAMRDVRAIVGNPETQQSLQEAARQVAGSYCRKHKRRWNQLIERLRASKK